jgi:UDP-N-acetylglucosamine:LPS N-acetylglucosamine transferase
VLLLDRDCTSERLAETVIDLARDGARLRAMGEAARRLGVPDAAARVVATCREVVAGGGGGGG